MSADDNRSLGKLQLIALEVLQARRHGGRWFPGSGWIMTNRSQTERIMESLEKRGLVTMTRVPYPRSISAGTYRQWEITDAGREVDVKALLRQWAWGW